MGPNWIYYLILIAIIIIAFKFNFIIGIILFVLALAYGIYSYIPTIHAVKGAKAFQAGNFEESKMYYKKAVDTKRAKLQIRVNYAYVLMRTGDFDEAERVLDNILRYKNIKPESKNLAKQQRCMVYYKQGRLDEAMSEAYEIFEEGYRNTSVYGMIGYFKILNGDNLDETLEFCKEAYDYNDEDRDILDNLSICYYKKGDYKEAEKISDKIIEQNPQFVEAYYHGAQIAVKLNKYEKAKELLEKIPGCRRSNMTTVSEQEVEDLKKLVYSK